MKNATDTCDDCGREFGEDQMVAQITCHEMKTISYVCEPCVQARDKATNGANICCPPEKEKLN